MTRQEELQKTLSEKGQEHRDKMLALLGGRGLNETQCVGLVDLSRAVCMIHAAIRTLATPGLNPIHKVQLANQMNNNIVETLMSSACSFLIGEVAPDTDMAAKSGEMVDHVVFAIDETRKLDAELNKLVAAENARPQIIVPGA